MNSEVEKSEVLNHLWPTIAELKNNPEWLDNVDMDMDYEQAPVGEFETILITKSITYTIRFTQPYQDSIKAVCQP